MDEVYTLHSNLIRSQFDDGKQLSSSSAVERLKVKVKVHKTPDIAPLRSESPPQKRSGMARVLKGFHSFTCTPTRSSAYSRNEPYLPLPSQPQLVLIYRPRRDGRLNRPWCEVTQAEIRTRNPRLQIRHSLVECRIYHTATSAPSRDADDVSKYDIVDRQRRRGYTRPIVLSFTSIVPIIDFYRATPCGTCLSVW